MLILDSVEVVTFGGTTPEDTGSETGVSERGVNKDIVVLTVTREENLGGCID